MCGIAGVFDAALPPEELRVALSRMEQSLIRRGPDEGAVRVFPEIRCGLAARRLSIVDLEGGSQPMSNEDGTVHAVLNGEIYNHAPLRQQLEAQGHQFKSRSDTEAIVHLYEERGEECLDRLHGMFAIAILDSRRKRLLLARDGPGMKPLYFAQTGVGTLFASEAKALFASGLLKPEPNLAAIDTFLALGFIPSPLTAFSGIEKLQPGHYIMLDSAGMHRGVFWRYRYDRPAESRSDEEYADELETLLSQAVRSHLAADVPVGAFLSGGWDSSLTATFAARHLCRRLDTFSIVFPDDPGVDESRFSRQMASHLGTDHHEIEFRNSMMPDLLPRVTRDLEEPCSNVPSAVVYTLASLAAGHLKTVISGEGADELFGGYRWLRSDRAYTLRGIVPKAPARLAASWLSHPRLRRALRFLGAPDDRIADAEWSRVFSPEDKRLILKPEFQAGGPDVDPVLIHPDVLATCNDTLQRRLGLEFTGRLADGILFMTDKVSMAHSLEVRMPFLDCAVVEFALRLPSRLKVDQGREKVVLSALARRHLPPEIATRRKQGLGYPARTWTGPPMNTYSRELLLDGAGSGPFSVAFLHRSLPRWLNPRNGRPIFLSRAVALQIWWNEFIA